MGGKRSCHQKRVAVFGELPCEEVLKAVPHGRMISSLPKILRRSAHQEEFQNGSVME
jgi:hypothetical protein